MTLDQTAARTRSATFCLQLRRSDYTACCARHLFLLVRDRGEATEDPGARAFPWRPKRDLFTVARSKVEARRWQVSECSVSPGVKCDFCHVPGNWKADGKPPMSTTRAMETLMKEFPKYFDFANASAFTCFTCHQGQIKVVR